MKKLFHQMIKFGLVGVICFVIDYITGLIVLNVLMALFTDAWFVQYVDENAVSTIH